MEKKITESFRKTGIRDFRVEIEHSYPWVSIHLSRLDCGQMEQVASWIRKTFSKEGKYSHMLPTLGMRFGKFCLIISKEQCEEKFGDLV